MTNAIIIGAGPAGLACAATLKERGMNATILESSEAVASAWRRHYDRLHLHTDCAHSGLPGLPMPRTCSAYPARAEVVAYLEAYALHFQLNPVFNSPVSRVEREGDVWRVETNGRALRSANLIIATGRAQSPVRPAWSGAEDFAGEILHSRDYRNPERLAGRRVLVAGFGNSAAEIALDLAEAGISVTMAVRSPVCVLPRDLLGLPILTWSIALRGLPPKLADILAAPAIRLKVGSLQRIGLQKSPFGPARMIAKRARVPVLDIGAIARIRDGSITVRPGVRRLEAGSVVFEDGRSEGFDAIIQATGYRADAAALLPGVDGIFDDEGAPLVSGGATAQAGLFFCGFHVAPTGMLREIGLEAERIASIVARQAAHGSIRLPRHPPSEASVRASGGTHSTLNR